MQTFHAPQALHVPLDELLPFEFCSKVQSQMPMNSAPWQTVQTAESLIVANQTHDFLWSWQDETIRCPLSLILEQAPGRFLELFSSRKGMSHQAQPWICKCLAQSLRSWHHGLPALGAMTYIFLTASSIRGKASVAWKISPVNKHSNCCPFVFVLTAFSFNITAWQALKEEKVHASAVAALSSVAFQISGRNGGQSFHWNEVLKSHLDNAVPPQKVHDL